MWWRVTLAGLAKVATAFCLPLANGGFDRRQASQLRSRCKPALLFEQKKPAEANGVTDTNSHSSLYFERFE
jgi:hypothetical protein